MSILRDLRKLHSLHRKAGTFVATERQVYEVFSTDPPNLKIWKQVPTLEEAVVLAQHLVEQHEGSILNVWHHDEGHLYQAENRRGRVKEIITPPPKEAPPKKKRPLSPTMRGDWDKQMGEYWQSTAAPIYRDDDIGGDDYYWVRIGEQGEYEPWDSIQEVSKILQGYNSYHYDIGPVLKWVQYGIETENFLGNNYISLYIGGETAQPIRELSLREKHIIEEVLNTDIYPSSQKAVIIGNLVYRRSVTVAAESVNDVGFGFVGMFDPDMDKKRQEALLPKWVLEKMRESRETIPEVTDEDVVKIHGCRPPFRKKRRQDKNNSNNRRRKEEMFETPSMPVRQYRWDWAYK